MQRPHNRILRERSQQKQTLLRGGGALAEEIERDNPDEESTPRLLAAIAVRVEWLAGAS